MPRHSQLIEALDGLRAEAASCKRCPVNEIGPQTVHGSGNVDAKLMFIGVAPGAREDHDPRER